MSAAQSLSLPMPQLEAPEFAPGDLTGIAKFIRRRVSYELGSGQHDSREHIFPELQRRIINAARGCDWTGRPAVFRQGDLPDYLAALEADLRQMATMPTTGLQRCVMAQSPFPHGKGFHVMQIEEQNNMVAAGQAALPRVQPSELLAQFAARGVVVKAEDGNLHVSPTELLTDADREVLRNNKPGILAALDRPAEVL